MRKSSQEDSTARLQRSENEIDWVFTNTYDFSSFLDSEIQNIKKHMSLEEFAKQEIMAEREHIFQEARKYDISHNYPMMAISCTQDRYECRRYVCLEDAMRQLLYGDCKLGCEKRASTYIYSEGKIWLIVHIPKSENIYIPEKYKYDERYLNYLVENKLYIRFGLKAWYHGKNDNIKKQKRYKDNNYKGSKEKSTEYKEIRTAD